ncbi:hypothetical protein [Phaeobacter italicus]|uniref:hypothetical protein n=1 Tax=Phaeobacter italicus TaxID=481446 RepID=UPI001CD4CC68|nr:hypothetical protein [Phaeobacter italicus]MCA0856173.1 hypothetical protein [Phaeobacter italicus]
MPRKNARPAAKKLAAKRKAKMAAKAKPQRRVAIVSHHARGSSGVLLAAMAAGLLKDQSS